MHDHPKHGQRSVVAIIQPRCKAATVFTTPRTSSSPRSRSTAWTNKRSGPRRQRIINDVSENAAQSRMTRPAYRGRGNSAGAIPMKMASPEGAAGRRTRLSDRYGCKPLPFVYPTRPARTEPKRSMSGRARIATDGAGLQLTRVNNFPVEDLDREILVRGDIEGSTYAFIARLSGVPFRDAGALLGRDGDGNAVTGEVAGRRL